MSDDERPDNVLTLPRIGSPPPPDLPPAPDLTTPAPADPGDGAGVRISPWDAPEIPHAPAAPDGAAVLRSEGTNPPSPPDAGAPRAGALSLAAVLAIALAAFEGMQTWITEAVPLRAEAARHRREIELLAAKATADAQRLGAEASAIRRRGVPSGHDYGRSVFGSGGSGGRGRGGAFGNGTFGRGNGTGPGGRSGPGRASGSTLGSTGAGRTNTGRTSTGPSGPSGRGSGGSAGGGSSRTFAGGTRNGGPGGGPGNGSRGGGTWAGRNGGGSGGSSGGSSGSGGRRSMGRKVADWWSKGSQGKAAGGGGGGSRPSGTSGGGSGGTASKGALRNAVRRAQKGKGAPTFWEAAGDQLRNRWKGRQTNTGGTVGGTGGGSGRAAGAGPGPVNNGWKPGGRTTFRQAVYETIGDRWNKRREDWKANGGPRRKRTDFRQSPGARPSSKGTSDKGSRGGGGDADGSPGWTWARSSAFDTDDGPDVVITVEQAGPARSHGTRWEPTPIAPPGPQLPRTGPPVLPRAPQRPAGSRPGTTRPKEAIPMPASPARTGTAGVPAAVGIPGRMAAQHATEITLGGALDALSKLVSAGLTTYDACVELGRQARRLLAELEAMAADLAVNHNVNGTRTRTAHAELMEAVTEMVGYIDRMARSSLAAAEAAEAEETAMARHYRPTQAAAQDAGLHTPSARVHNEN
ncbi:hypothetical protein ACWDGI_41865 [Streptomyces sp. NPDC001220]